MISGSAMMAEYILLILIIRDPGGIINQCHRIFRVYIILLLITKHLIRVIDDLVQPNGIVGTPDGKTLFVADIGGK